MTKDRTVRKLYEWRPIVKRVAGRPRCGWQKGIKEDLQFMQISNWTQHTQVRVKMKDVVGKADCPIRKL
jgi:hypothetical protein